MKNDLIELNNKTDELVDQLIKEEDPDKAKEMINFFNMNIAKKNAIRVVKVNELLDKINDEAIKRVSENADGINDKDLISYMSAAQSQIEKSMNNIKSINEIPPIQLNQDNSVNINIQNELSKESRERVLAVVQNILNRSKDDEAIDVEVVNKDN